MSGGVGGLFKWQILVRIFNLSIGFDKTRWKKRQTEME